MVWEVSVPVIVSPAFRTSPVALTMGADGVELSTLMFVLPTTEVTKPLVPFVPLVPAAPVAPVAPVEPVLPVAPVLPIEASNCQ